MSSAEEVSPVSGVIILRGRMKNHNDTTAQRKLKTETPKAEIVSS